MSAWRGINAGDTIDLVAPASQCDKALLQRGIKVIESWGLRVRVSKKIFASHPYLAQSDEQRFELLKEAILNPESKVIWAVRGGYGCSRIVEKLSKLKPKTPKIFIGYSDNSWLHHMFNELWGWQGLHGPLVAELDSGKLLKSNLKALKKYLLAPELKTTYGGLRLLNSVDKKIIKGPIVGGNLSVLQTTLGTSRPFNSRGKIVFFEDVGERGYSVDRILTHCAQAGVFKGAKAIIFGEFTGAQEPSGKTYIKKALTEFSKEFKIPVLTGLKVGHGPHNHPIHLYKKAQINLGQKSVLSVFNES